MKCYRLMSIEELNKLLPNDCRLKFVKFLYANDSGRYYETKCVCGKIKTNKPTDLIKGNTKSCGCKKREWLISNVLPKMITHKMSKTPEYKSWQKIKERCYCKNSPEYNSYGLKGIKMSKNFINNFEEFYREIGERPSHEYTVDRIDNSKGYIRGNIRWLTRWEQNQNRSDNLSHTIVCFIKVLIAEGYTNQEIGLFFKINWRKVWSIRREKTWGNITI